MKTLLVLSLIGLLPVLAHAQAAPADPDVKLQPFEPVLARDHTGAGRIGVHLIFDKVTGLPVIGALTRGGPAADYGFRVGDTILKIDKNYTNTLTQEEISLALHGKPGTGVELTIQREDCTRYIVRAVPRRILLASQEEMTQPPQSEMGPLYVPPAPAPAKP